MKTSRLNVLVNEIILSTQVYHGIQLRLKIGQLLVEALKEPQHIPSPCANRQGKSWDKAEPGYEPHTSATVGNKAGVMIIDDVYETHPGFNFGPLGNYYDERLRATVKARVDSAPDGAPIVILHSRVHEEDVLGISAEDRDILATIEASLGVPKHLLGGTDGDDSEEHF